MKTLSSFGGHGGPDLMFLLVATQFLFAIWLSCHRYRDEPHWKTVSVLFSLLLLGMPGFLAALALRAGLRNYLGDTGSLPPQNR